MATVCTTCGQELPRDDAHFCNNCGTLVPSHPFSAQSLAANAAAKAVQPELQKPLLREQRVQSPAAKPVEQAQRPPRTTRRIAPDDISKSAISWPAPLTHVSVKEPQAHNEIAHIEPQVPQAVHEPESVPTSARELHVKVWDQERINPLTPLPESREELQEHIEDTPTTPLETSGAKNVEDAPTSIQTRDARDTAVEYLDTVPMPNYVQPKLSEPAPQAVASPRSLPGNSMAEQRTREQRAQPYDAHTSPPISQPIAPVAQQPAPPAQQMNTRSPQHQYQQPMAVQEIKAPPVATLPPATASRQKSRVPFIILLACLCVLILGGGAWIVLANPFAVPAVTQPLQSFRDTQLGVSLTYPSGWTNQKSASGVVFADSSRTAQINLSATASNGDAATYIQQQATKSGITAVKALGTVSFAGTSWQQIQGNLQQDGVNYTVHMFAAIHSSRMYMLMQIAPQNVYNDEESVVFSAVRNSFMFL